METSRLIPIFVKIFYDVKIKEVVFALERFAPLPLQESYDNASRIDGGGSIRGFIVS